MGPPLPPSSEHEARCGSALDGLRIARRELVRLRGTNAHVVVEEAPTVETAIGGALNVFAASTGCCRCRRVRRGPGIAGVTISRLDGRESGCGACGHCATAGAGRSHFEHRAALVVDSRRRARRLLGALHEDRPAPGLTRGSANDRPKTAWLFPGQGSQFREWRRRCSTANQSSARRSSGAPTSSPECSRGPCWR